jgi:protocatechuate 3,4-dioxygenase, beta subunit
MKQLLIMPFLLMIITQRACSQADNKTNNQKVGGGCEGCEGIFESPVPFHKLSWIDTLPDFNEPGPKMVISGIIYKADGKTPAKDVVLYIYHTDQTGHYSKKGNEKGWGLRHGYIRGWLKTNEKGEYKFYTLRPAAYPNANIPQHIHPAIKEPGINQYWIDEYVFDDDPKLTAEERSKTEKRGGSGIIKLQQKNGMLYGERNIILGMNVPNYPTDRRK